MLRFFLSAVALAGILAMQRPALADPVSAVAAVHAEAATGHEQAAPVPSIQSSSSDAPSPVNAGLGKDIIAVGFGWG